MTWLKVYLESISEQMATSLKAQNDYSRGELWHGLKAQDAVAFLRLSKPEIILPRYLMYVALSFKGYATNSN